MTESKDNALTAGNLPESAKERVTRALKDLPKVKLDMSEDGMLNVGLGGDYGRIVAGSGNLYVSNGLVNQISILGAHRRKIDEEASNFALGFLDSMAPRDAAETLLLAQMATIHLATMMLARRLNHVENIPQQDAAERALNKLARTYAVQVEALKRYRSQGQQTVRVEHVTVNAGGQAIVGNVTRGEGAKEK